MRLRDKLTWITVTVLALSAEGSAGAQSAPSAAPAPSPAAAHSPACSASDPTLACMGQWSAPVGPELAAARASLGAATKKSDTGTPVDWNSLANHQAVAGATVAGGLALPSGAGGAIPSNAGGADNLQVLHGDATGAASTTAGPAIRVVPVGTFQDGWSSTNAPAPHAETVIRGQINPAAKSCYENDPDSASRQPGKLNILIKLTPTGEVDSVTVASNLGVSPSVASCITTAAGAARFAAPGAKGATVRATFTFPGREELPAPSAPRALGAQGPNAPGRAAREALADTHPANGETARR